MSTITNITSRASSNMSQNEDDIQTGSDVNPRSSNSHQETPVVVVATPEAERNSEDGEVPSMNEARGSLEKSYEHRLLETISNTLTAQNELMAEQKNTLEVQNKLMNEQKKIMEAMVSKYKVPQSESHFC